MQLDHLQVKPQGWIGKCGDALMLPVMYLLQLTVRELPQRTHRWNNTKYSAAAVRHLDAALMVSIPESETVSHRWWGPVPIFHIPLISGWRHFYVLEPTTQQEQWFIGWIAGDVIGVSRIPLTGAVRLLQSDYSVQFFGLNEHGDQIGLKRIGEGIVGQAGQFRHIPLR